jgi:CubicO group peptidase (beta-lactamase class C family)
VRMRTAVILFLTLIVATMAVAADANTQKVDQLLASFDNPGSPGCSVGVIRNGDFIYKKSFGYGSLELGVPLTPESVFYMGSVSKQFTAASVVLAAEQGYLSLDDDVRKYLPELPDYGHRVTLRQMLHQTSGFRDFLDLAYLAGRNFSDLASPAEVLDLIVRQKRLNNVPGEEWIYSNSNYFLLGEVVHRATNKSLARFAAENIFQPLGMSHTLFYDDNTLVVPKRVAAYEPGKNGKFLVDWSTTYDIVGGGGLMSNVEDLLFWDRNFYSDKLGKGNLPKEMQSHGVLNNGNQIDYAMGLSLGDYRGLPTVEHNGALFGYHTAFLRFPLQRFSAIILCNLATADPEGLVRKIADVYLAADLTKADSNARGNLPDPAPFAGTYLDPRTKTIYRFSAEHGNLRAWGALLRRIDANRFYDLGSGIITFESMNGSMHASLDLPGERYFSGNKLQPAQLEDAALKRLAGTYHSGELDATYTLAVEKGVLMLRVGKKAPIALIPATGAKFYSDDFRTLVFHSEGERISGFSIFTQGSRNIQFTRVD